MRKRAGLSVWDEVGEMRKFKLRLADLRAKVDCCSTAVSPSSWDEATGVFPLDGAIVDVGISASLELKMKISSSLVSDDTLGGSDR